MALLSPNLDDRNFTDLLEEARRRAVLTCPDWTDLSPNDPGMVLLELFAYLTEIMIYRLNRIPDKAYIEFLRLIGVRLQPPSPATVMLRFSRALEAAVAPVQIPRGTRVTVTRTDGASEPAVFVVAQAVNMGANETQVDALAHHCELVEAEFAGKGTGLPSLFVTAKRPPIVARTGDELDLVVGIETPRAELEERAPAVLYQGKAYRIWREVESFTNLPEPFVYVVDRMTGVITFAPSARMRNANGELQDAAHELAAIPPAGRDILLSYRRGGGPTGNVAAGSITTLKDQIPGIQVTNPDPATGGRAGETLENALIRGPQEIHSLQRAVTARDFEMLALRSSAAIARARAFTKSMLWVHASPGTVEVLLVPDIPESKSNPSGVSIERLHEHWTEADRSRIQAALDERRPLGTTCLVNWARYKMVRVSARVVARREEDLDALRGRVLQRLYESVNPLPAGNYTGWRFGQALRAFNVYDIVVAEPGVSYVDQVQLQVEEVPEKDVKCIAADRFQQRTWYAGTTDALFRTLNDGDGWEPAGQFPGESVEAVAVNPNRAGLVAAVTSIGGDAGSSRVYVSGDCGETWTLATETAFHIEDAVWIAREGGPVLLLATRLGLYELAIRAGAPPVQILVDGANKERGFYAVVVSTDVRGAVSVAVASQSTGGVYLSTEGGKPNTFRKIGLTGEDVRVLAVQDDGSVSYLWAGVAGAGGDDPGKGCYRWELKTTVDAGQTWQAFQKNWDGGSCLSIAFKDSLALAATHRRGVLRIDARKPESGWLKPELGCGLPLREAERLFHRVDAVAVDPKNRFLLAGGPAGVYRSKDGGVSFAQSSTKAFTDKITLPETWLFCSGEHDIRVVSEDQPERD